MRRLTRNLFLLDLFEEGLFRLDQELFNTEISLRVIGGKIPQFLNKARRNLTIGIGKLLLARFATMPTPSLTDSMALLRGDEAPFSSTIDEIESNEDTRECIENGRDGANEFRPS